jgi:hypothetical protein
MYRSFRLVLISLHPFCALMGNFYFLIHINTGHTYRLLFAQVILRVAFPVATRSVRPRQGRAASVLLTVKKTSVEYTVIMSSLHEVYGENTLLLIIFSLYTVNYFVKPACAGDSHYWHVIAPNIMSKWSKDRGGANVSCQTRTETFFR